ncbi:MAG: hypothetical protein GY771_02680 [bacterium]|nr:hypothetical protein [bacterium]
MRNIITLLLAVLLMASSVYAAESGGWDEGLFWWEAGAGLLGAAAALGITAAVGGNASPFYSISGVLGNATGVLLTGEIAGAPSKNWYLTYPLTFVTSAAYPLVLLVAAFPIMYGKSYGLQVGVASCVALSTPIATAVVYNWLKKPVVPEEPLDTGFNIRPYATYLADSGGGMIPVYGVSVSF